ncbi:DNA-binding transcriptional LysR family regulator [Kibdelosporangium banguiense]|uniref:DNA-binding transcriptional LysR family regulator n=1 Tax=Kibdelosporangium banguiense TaxID=1365924 RepID=A0ABS4TNC6_9PSEU|nr:LysR family transcriptional regulator [Kibdelosporangium banguiense]MBP2325907.1 DNA-binding transcriptional LysR family regulator [Kibdelosporangium banguiense]
MGDLDLAAVRAFVAVADNQHFGDAAAQLGITQQAVSKRVAKLESEFGVLLLSRQASGTRLSQDGAAFLPYARNLLATAEKTVEMLRGRRLPLRIDVLDTRLASTELVREFHSTASDIELEIVTSIGLRAARGALKAGTVDAAFVRAIGPLDQDGIAAVPAYLEPLQVMVGPGHPLAKRSSVTMPELSGCTVWMPGNAQGSEWADFYDSIAAEFSVRIDTSGPDFGYEHFVRRFAESPHLLGFVGELTRLPQYPGVVRIPVQRPTPCYLCSLLWHRPNPHPALPKLVSYVRQNYRAPGRGDVWLARADVTRIG